jgi:hypothetical protein
MSTTGTLPLPDETATNHALTIKLTGTKKKPRRKVGRRLMTEDSRRINLETRHIQCHMREMTACLREIR